MRRICALCIDKGMSVRKCRQKLWAVETGRITIFNITKLKTNPCAYAVDGRLFITREIRVSDFLASSMLNVATSWDKNLSSIISLFDLENRFDTILNRIINIEF